jgi:hypothetical protein
MEANRPARPSLLLRLGITGARDLPADQSARIQAQLGEVFASVKLEMQRLSSLNQVADCYAHEAGAPPSPKICLITPLALGADRMAARQALDQGCEIYVPMPFPQEIYEQDFAVRDDQDNDQDKYPAAKPPPPGTTHRDLEVNCAEFRRLLSKAAGSVELDGARSATPQDDGSAARAYEAVGRFVVRHCDLLLAVWDGRQSKGRGGTAEIVHYAAAAGVPVWWIHAQQEKRPEWLADIHDIQYATQAELTASSAESKLQAHLRHLVLPPAKVHRHRKKWMERIASVFQEEEAAPLKVFFAERPRGMGGIWKTYSAMMAWAGGKGKGWQPAPPPDDPAARYWFDRFATADGRAMEYAARYRSSYVLTIGLTTLALIFGACTLGFGLSNWSHPTLLPWMARGEFAMLLLILILVLTSLRLDWHGRSIEYRLLAELFRKQETLAALGWALSIGNVQNLADTERLFWVAWLFAAMQRAAPLPGSSFAGQGARCLDVLTRLIREQLEYHEERERIAEKATDTFERFGGIAFCAVFACVVLKMIAESSDWGRWVIVLGLLATVLPGVSAACVTVRSYAELQLLAEQSHHMIVVLRGVETRVGRINPDNPLVSQEIGAQAAAVATLMLQDLDGWGRLFRGKSMEAS